PDLADDLRRLLLADEHFESTERGIEVDLGTILEPETQDLPADIGGYRVKGVLGQGGCGIVYRAEQDKPRRDVALKVLHSRYEDTALVRRFEREGEVLG